MEFFKLPFFLLVVVAFSLPHSASSHSPFNLSEAPHQPFPAIFALGDSTLDPGNNNHIADTLFRSDHRPYGRDLPQHPASGRFTNGKLTLDVVSSTWGLKDLLPAYRDPQSLTDQQLLTGVSFASAGTGFDDQTATISHVLTMSTQLNDLQRALGRIESAVGSQRARQIASNALFAIGAGSNDMLWNFYKLPTRRGEFNVSGYQDFLLGKLESVVQQIYNTGARRFALSGLPPIGCLPLQRLPGGACIEQQNIDSQGYNAKLQDLITGLQARLVDSRIVYIDIYSPLIDMIHNPDKYSFQETTRGCCGTGLIEMGSLCCESAPTCPDASRFMFWDAVHPTQPTYQILADKFIAAVLPHLVN